VAEETGLPETEVSRIDQLGTAAEASSSVAFDPGGESIRSIADPAAPSPADRAEECEDASTIRAALQRLSSNQSVVLRHHYFDGLTLQEIAAALGLSVVRVHQLRVAVEACLRNDACILDAWVELRLQPPRQT
jgi:RNA polymerase sigma factor (sigma-70 family)